jgi:hypothetical protein
MRNAPVISENVEAILTTSRKKATAIQNIKGRKQKL